MRARGRALADDDVELVVLERGVELFFEHGLEAVDLVEEEDLLVAQVGEDGGQVALDLQRGAGGLLEADAELVGDDGREGGFAQAGRAEEQDVVERFVAGFGGFEGDGELLLGFLLADEFAEARGAELQLEGLVVIDARGGDQAVGVGRWGPASDLFSGIPLKGDGTAKRGANQMAVGESSTDTSSNQFRPVTLLMYSTVIPLTVPVVTA